MGKPAKKVLTELPKVEMASVKPENKSGTIKVAGIVFQSTKAAAKYVTMREKLRGNMRDETTVYKKLNAFKKGKKKDWKIYDRYGVTKALTY